MRNQRQGVRSTKVKAPAQASESKQNISGKVDAVSASQYADQDCDNNNEANPIKNKQDIFVAVYNPRDTMFTDQTGKFPYTSTRDNNYQMVVHDINGGSTWVEPMKTGLRAK